MQFREDKISGCFDNRNRKYIIPKYQRAYSWEQKNWQVFFDDIKEQANSENEYFFGNILLEDIGKGEQFEIVDGQQRLTTLVIFMRSVINTLSQLNSQDNEAEIKRLTEVYLIHDGNTKLRTVHYDNAFFEQVIINNENSNVAEPTHSQTNIGEAKKFFQKELEKLAQDDLDLLKRIICKVDCTKLSIVTLTGKKEAALMFELQNNRGAALTELEKLKAYFMYQAYIQSTTEETEQNINYIAGAFDTIYSEVSRLRNIHEDDVLRYHCHAYTSTGYGYRTIDTIKEELRKNSPNGAIKWIHDFVVELQKSFSNLIKFERLRSEYARKLKQLGIPAFIYPFVLKGYKYLQDEKKLDTFFRILEALVFRDKVIQTNANITSRLSDILREFEGDLENLKVMIVKMLHDKWYWTEEKLQNTLDGQIYGNNAIHYILWEYEASLEHPRGYKIKEIELQDESIEHIAPQTEQNKRIATGYEKYDKEWEEGGYLHCLGNLLLISKSHNSSLGNKPFAKKIESYRKAFLLRQQIEVETFIDNKDKPLWSKSTINKRHEKIVNFVLERWNFEKILIASS